MWTKSLQEALRTPEDLAQQGLISWKEAQDLAPAFKKYQFLLPRYYANLIDKENPRCPIRLQAIPTLKEMHSSPGWSEDPLLDLSHQPKPHITERFQGRVLIHLTSNCSMYCRFCFRKSLLNALKEDLFGGSLEEAFQYVESNLTVEEVIFSGGDPLMLSDSALSQVAKRVSQIPHIERVRFHTRVPVTFPERITEELLECLKEFGKPVILVSHFNHPKELTPLSIEKASLLKQDGITLLNQSVLLKEVNDSADCLATLSRKLFSAGILPYYLHHLDRASGTSHFEVSLEKGRAIVEELRTSLSGYLVPKYVIDRIGSAYKEELL